MLALIVVVLLFIGFIYYYYVREDSNIVDLSTVNTGDYLDQNIVALNSLSLLESGEIRMKVDEIKNFRNKNFFLNIRRGNNLKLDNEVYSSYLFEIFNERSTSSADQFVIIGVPISDGSQRYHLIMHRKIKIKG